MSEFQKEIVLTLDLFAGGDHPLVALQEIDETSVARSIASAAVIYGEKRELLLRFGSRDPATGLWTPLTLSAGDSISVSGKAKTVPESGEGTLLFFADSFAEETDGEGKAYRGEIQFAGSSLLEAITSDSLACLVDIRILSSSLLVAVSQFELIVRRRMHESSPTPPEILPLYLTASESDLRYLPLVERGSEDLSLGDLTGSIEFAAAAASIPAIFLALQAPSGATSAIFAAVIEADLEGFSYRLSASIPAAGWKLAWLALA